MRFLILLFISLSFQIVSQNFCGTDIKYFEQLAQNPDAAQKQTELQDYIKHYNQQQSSYKSSSIKIIPVVFHVFHNYGPENISNAQIHDAVRILNEDYQKRNADTSLIVASFKPLIADCEIEFRLAQIDPNGNCTDGITRHASMLTYSGGDNVKDSVSWDTKNYLNIWVVSSINIPNVAGFAYYPGTAPAPHKEGIVIEQSYVGSFGTSSISRSRILTHEAGHYFGLYHTFGLGTCGDTANCSNPMGDNVTDTPPTKGNCSSCNLNANSCGQLENTQNFMDYSSCIKMFTNGQKANIHAALTSTIAARNNLWSPSNLSFTGVLNNTVTCVPVADFKTSIHLLCATDSILYTDNSWNGTPTQWLWNFEGGTPPTSTLQNPMVKYNSPGTFSVSLISINSAGQDTASKTSFMVIASNIAAYSGNYTESFEGAAIPNSDWDISSFNTSITWQTTSNTSFTGLKCVYLDNYNNPYNNEWDELLSPSLNVASVANPILSFQVAFARRFGAENDKLEVLYSLNCGESWTVRYSKGANLLKTANSISTPFTPANASEWRKDFVNLTPVMNKTNVRFKFRFTSNFGNNIYLDDINLQPIATGINEDFALQNLVVYPSVTKGEVTVSFYTIKPDEETTINITDMYGRIVKTIDTEDLVFGNNTRLIDLSSMANGLYTISLNTRAGILRTKIVKG